MKKQVDGMEMLVLLLIIGGFPVNYFKYLRTLNIGDEIIYRYGNQERVYVVDVITVIYDTNWSYLYTTQDNRITLITCVEYEPYLRRVVQARERI